MVVSLVPAASAKLHEVAPNVVLVNIGAQVTGGLGVNKRSLERLPAPVQKIFREVGIAYADEFAKVQMATADKALADMRAAGAKIVEFDPAERKRWADALPPVAKTWAADAQGKGLPANEVLGAYMGAFTRGGAKVPRDWSK